MLALTFVHIVNINTYHRHKAAMSRPDHHKEDKKFSDLLYLIQERVKGLELQIRLLYQGKNQFTKLDMRLHLQDAHTEVSEAELSVVGGSFDEFCRLIISRLPIVARLFQHKVGTPNEFAQEVTEEFYEPLRYFMTKDEDLVYYLQCVSRRLVGAIVVFGHVDASFALVYEAAEAVLLNE